MAIAKNPKVIMNDKEFVDRLTIIKNRKTFYKNKYPYNLCYINKDGRTSADCVNLVKTICVMFIQTEELLPIVLILLSQSLTDMMLRLLKSDIIKEICQTREIAPKPNYLLNAQMYRQTLTC